MIHLGLRSEYSFKGCYGYVQDLVNFADQGMVGIADVGNTFGHVQFSKACKSADVKPIFGVKINVLDDGSKQRTCNLPWTFIAKNDEGLIEIYELVKKSYDQFYYTPRLHLSDVLSLSKNVSTLTPYSSEISSLPASPQARARLYTGVNRRYLVGEGCHVALVDNNYLKPEDRSAYQIIGGRRKDGNEYMFGFEDSVYTQHVIDDKEYVRQFGNFSEIHNAFQLGQQCNASLTEADMVKYSGKTKLSSLCKFGARKKGIDLKDPIYEARYEREMELIKDKGYEDYFLIVADLINKAKEDMLVGPSRGSSAGSLVCYLSGITEIDPIKHDLLFERFIDVNRFDLPDIDIDFPDVDRQKVVKYLSKKYGDDNVRTLANINRLKAKSAIGEAAISLGIPKYETEAVKGAIIERSSGDARAAMCIDDTFDTTEPGKDFIEQYPAMRITTKLENHASHAGKHAAGVIVSTLPLTNYCGINSRDDVCMIDKKDAEELGLLKIDVLGLRTLSIIQDAMRQIGKPLKDVYKIPLDDEKTFAIFNDMRLYGVFQFEGYALQSLTRQMGVNRFEDIVAITALARPGALNSGGASRYVKYHTGVDQPNYFNDTHKKITEETYGITVYQEQMMEIARQIGRFSWEDVSTLRKAASKSLGDEFFGKYKDKFIEGAKETGLDDQEAEEIWNDISHSGSWSFNKSHAVSYGYISYWTAWLKANHPMEFAVAALNNAMDDSHAIKLLRDLVRDEGMEYIPVNPDISDVDWTVYDNKLLGGLKNIKGVADKKAKQIINARQGKGKIGPAMFKLLEAPETPFDIIFPTNYYWGRLFTDPVSYGLNDAPVEIKTIDEPGDYTFVGCLVDRNLRDLNEYTFLKDRDGEIIEENNLYLNLTVEDDTDSIICTINRWRFEELGGKKIAEEGKVGESWYLIRGKVKGAWRKIEVSQIVDLKETLGEIHD